MIKYEDATDIHFVERELDVISFVENENVAGSNDYPVSLDVFMRAVDSIRPLHVGPQPIAISFGDDLLKISFWCKETEAEYLWRKHQEADLAAARAQDEKCNAQFVLEKEKKEWRRLVAKYGIPNSE